MTIHHPCLHQPCLTHPHTFLSSVVLKNWFLLHRSQVRRRHETFNGVNTPLFSRSQLGVKKHLHWKGGDHDDNDDHPPASIQRYWSTRGPPWWRSSEELLVFSSVSPPWPSGKASSGSQCGKWHFFRVLSKMIRIRSVKVVYNTFKAGLYDTKHMLTSSQV